MNVVAKRQLSKFLIKTVLRVFVRLNTVLCKNKSTSSTGLIKYTLLFYSES